MAEYGYPDYNRLSTEVDKQLFSYAYAIIISGLDLFQGFVGPWGSVNVVAATPNASDIGAAIITWYTDNTFSNPLQESYMVRTANNAGVSQFANLSPWLRIHVQSASGNDLEWGALSATLTNFKSDSMQLNDVSIPGASFDGVIAANSSQVVNWDRIIRGPGRMLWDAGTTNYTLLGEYYKWSDNTWHAIRYWPGSVYGTYGQESLPIADAPTRVTIQNNDTSGHTFRLAWWSEA